jgi:hypothetical protein
MPGRNADKRFRVPDEEIRLTQEEVEVGVGAAFSSCSDVYANRTDPNDWEFDIFPCGPSFAGGAMLSAPLNPIYHGIFG